MAKVCFIGLGVMGYPMAGHLSKAGHQVFVYNRTIEKTKKWTKEFKGQVCNSPRRLQINQSIYLYVLEMMMMFCQFLMEKWNNFRYIKKLHFS